MIDAMIEVTINKEDDFLKIRETLTRIGVSSQKTKTIYKPLYLIQVKKKL